MNVLLTGGAGFIGSHILDYILRNTNLNVILLDKLDHSGNLNRVSELESYKAQPDRVRYVHHDLRAPMNSLVCRQIGFVDYILHFAALTHVDRSIESPLSAVMDNVVGTCNILNFARAFGCRKMINFSTDEVYGPAPEGVKYKEWDRYNSTNPYSASKAGANELCLAFYNTYRIPVTIATSMNVFGKRQHPEKFIPGTVKKVRDGELVSIHSDATRTIPGSRFYISADNVADAVWFLVNNGANGEKYNIVGEVEVDNLSLAMSIANTVGKGLRHEMVDFHSSRPGHDLRYALDGAALAKLGWKQPATFEASLEETVKWTLENDRWL